MRSTSTNAAICYNRIHHIIVFIVLFVITGWAGAIIVSLLVPIQTMKFYQHTGLGDSITFMRGSLLTLLLQGLCQGNHMAPTGWAMSVAVLIHCYKYKGLGASIGTPMSGWIIEFIRTMFVDNIDLNVMDGNLRTSGQIY